MEPVGQSTSALLPRTVDWTEWLDSYGYTVSQIASITFAITFGPGTIEQQTVSGAVGTVYVDGTVAGKITKVTCTITLSVMANSKAVEDTFSFTLIGTNP